MCGLFGFVSFQSPASHLIDRAVAALGTLAHRGPDQWSHYIDGQIYIGHRRLSILDLSEAGKQPMRSDDGAVVISVNGEIYNHRELARKLSNARLQSKSDSEVGLHCYREWGLEKTLDQLDGMYAIVIYDKATNSITLVRDRPGIKPIYYSLTNQYFVWASELKAIEYFIGPDRLSFNNEALYDFLTYRYIPAPKTAYKEVNKLLPAHYLKFAISSRAMALKPYWALPTDVKAIPVRDAAEKVRAVIGSSVNEQLVSDVPVGCFLSGGVDSTIVTHYASNAIPRVHTFSIGFDVKSYDESKYASLAAAHCGTTHHTRRLQKESSLGILTSMRELYDEPFGDYSAMPTLEVSKLAKKHVTVCLSGDGGDELFGGYPWYDRIPQIIKYRTQFRLITERVPPITFRRRPQNPLQRVQNKMALYLGSSFFELYVLLMNGVPSGARQPWRHSLGILKDYDDYWLLRNHFNGNLGLRRALQYLDFHTYLPNDILTKVDRASMAVSLECRVPFLSKAVIEFAFSLPESFLYFDGKLKGGLKYAYDGLLPDGILRRPKKGFGIPVASWGVLGSESSFEIGVLRDFQKSRAVSAFV